MSTTTSRPLDDADGLQRYATLVAEALDAQAASPDAAADDGLQAGAPTAADVPGSDAPGGPDDALDAATWWAAHVRRPSSPPAGRPGPAAPLPYREAVPPVPAAESRLDRRG